MTGKRFTIVDEQFISYYGGTGHKISNGECGFWLWHSKEESQKVCDKLNSILDENEQLKKEKECDKQVFTKKRLHELLQQTQKENERIKHIIKESIRTERTDLGRNVLKQLADNLGVEYEIL